jgi:UDPglucose 6-dehydrogenase
MHEREAGPWRRSIDVPFVILGGTQGDRKLFRPMLLNAYGRKRSAFIHDCTATEAELAKYAANLHWAVRVTFVNEMAAITGAHGVDWEKVRDAWISDYRISEAYTSMDGYPSGFGGRCWPKDLKALIAAAKEAGYHPEFLEAVQEANERFRA